jgi:hypothetical protein
VYAFSEHLAISCLCQTFKDYLIVWVKMSIKKEYSFAGTSDLALQTLILAILFDGLKIINKDSNPNHYLIIRSLHQCLFNRYGMVDVDVFQIMRSDSF